MNCNGKHTWTEGEVRYSNGLARYRSASSYCRRKVSRCAELSTEACSLDMMGVFDGRGLSSGRDFLRFSADAGTAAC